MVPLVFAIHPGIPAKTLPELIAWFKANPDKAKVATSGRGSAQEMASEMFQMMSGAKLLMVPYKGSSAAHPDLLGRPHRALYRHHQRHPGPREIGRRARRGDLHRQAFAGTA